MNIDEQLLIYIYIFQHLDIIFLKAIIQSQFQNLDILTNQ
ncbi:hypothetical protein DDB_G0286785 [Dictyostelium discoideum AX4]|nr:hypothetical protein DDB_G0286785 [Dictyostelium discoideum AX4]EAL64148.1 hypothetical protein DDB_G0286785 [Dictyostelium discoideum AX4]|eukprot:XP_637668.1 hypothetical protein DDB_G0286785 [Dictyostelium discoideum AX4]